MINYKTIDNFQPGLIQKITKASYKKFIEFFPGEKQKLYAQWEQEDKEAFGNQDTIGKHILFTCFDEIPIGLFSWDDRNYPIGIIGQNCILPDFQGNGYGKRQIKMIIKIFRESKFKEIKVITGDHEFFIPSQKMYVSCGFRDQQKINGDIFKLLEFSKRI